MRFIAVHPEKVVLVDFRHSGRSTAPALPTGEDPVSFGSATVVVSISSQAGACKTTLSTSFLTPKAPGQSKSAHTNDDARQSFARDQARWHAGDLPEAEQILESVVTINIFCFKLIIRRALYNTCAFVRAAASNIHFDYLVAHNVSMLVPELVIICLSKGTSRKIERFRWGNLEDWA